MVYIYIYIYIDRILEGTPKRELLRSLWVGPRAYGLQIQGLWPASKGVACRKSFVVAFGVTKSRVSSSGDAEMDGPEISMVATEMLALRNPS